MWLRVLVVKHDKEFRAFLAIYYLFGCEGQEILSLLFSSLESHACYYGRGYWNNMVLTMLFLATLFTALLVQGQCSYSNLFDWN